ncbi:MAG TPA: serine/threonine-protein kinase, partial [Solirubrobacteraceae bacterium]|nr:serine/threonine-protein kinase [Solirubrobacteraceae bacterium]
MQRLETPHGGAAAPTRDGGEVVLGRYRMVRRIGAGGFGVVWLAEDLRLHRTVAVKRIVLADAATAARAEREARAAARLSHPAIVALYESGRDDEAVYLVSELVRGRSLAELERDGLLSDRDVVRAGIALCDALAHAHCRGVVHRDVKPANVIVPDDPAPDGGIVKLTDFGVAHMSGDDALTATGDVVGTLAYMAPEQAEGRRVTPAADLYALGLVLYEAFSGTNPIRADGAGATARRVGMECPPLHQLRPDL